MSLLFLEGFGGYAAGSHTNASGADPYLNGWNSWSGNFTVTQITSGTIGRRGYVEFSSTPNLRTPSFGGAGATIVIGFRFYAPGSNNFDTKGLIGGRDSSDNLLFNFGIDGYGYPCLLDNSGFYDEGNVLFRGTKRIIFGRWNYLELKITLNDTTGSYNFYVDGDDAGSGSSVDTLIGGTADVDYLRFHQGSLGEIPDNWRFADLYVDDATVHGPMEVWYQAADTAGSSSAWTPGVGTTNEGEVDEIGSDGDTSYNYSTATGTKDQIAHSDALPAAPLCIQPMCMVRAESTAENFQVGILSDPAGTPTEDLDTAVSVSSTSYVGVQGKLYELDPDTGSAWASAAAADAAETVYNHSA